MVSMNIGSPQCGQSRRTTGAFEKLSLCGCCTAHPSALYRRERDHLSVTDACGSARPVMRIQWHVLRQRRVSNDACREIIFESGTVHNTLDDAVLVCST